MDMNTLYQIIVSEEQKLINDKKHDCEYCGKKKCWTNKHHVKSKGASGNDTEDNLIELCGECHRKVHDGIIKKEQLLEIIKRRKKKQLGLDIRI